MDNFLSHTLFIDSLRAMNGFLGAFSGFSELLSSDCVDPDESGLETRDPDDSTLETGDGLYVKYVAFLLNFEIRRNLA